METSTKVDSWIRSVQFQQTDQPDQDSPSLSLPLSFSLFLCLFLFLNIAHSSNSFPGYSTTARLHRISAHAWMICVYFITPRWIANSREYRLMFPIYKATRKYPLVSLVSPYKNMIYGTDSSFRQLSASLTSFSRKCIGKYITNNTMYLTIKINKKK